MVKCDCSKWDPHDPEHVEPCAACDGKGVIDPTNLFVVGSGDVGIVIQRPMFGLPLTPAVALNLAAYLVLLADPGGEAFAAVLRAVSAPERS